MLSFVTYSLGHPSPNPAFEFDFAVTKTLWVTFLSALECLKLVLNGMVSVLISSDLMDMG